MLCGEGFEHRKQWIEDRIELLAEYFAISVGGFAVMENHLHLLVRLDPEELKSWSDEEVVRRWITVYTPRNLDLDDEKTTQVWIDHHAKDEKAVAKYRERLGELGWFMKALKEPLARMANKEDDCKGTFWEGRFKSIAILDEEALLATCAYIDLNPFAAGLSAAPETAKHTSVRQRVAHVRDQGKFDRLKAAKQGNAAACKVAGRIEQKHWLIPIDDRSHLDSSFRQGLLESFALGNYLGLLDYTSRLFRKGKARLNDQVRCVFERLGTSADFWCDRLKKMLSSKSLHGRHFAGSRERLTELAEQRGHHHLTNLSPQPAG